VKTDMDSPQREVVLSIRESFHAARTGEKRYDVIVFEIKKEIPIDQAKQDPAQTIATRTE